MERLEAARRTAAILHDQVVAGAPAVKILDQALRACLILTGARTALFIGSAHVPEELRNYSKTFDRPGESPPLAPILLETARRVARPWVPEAIPGDGNGTPSHVIEAIYVGDSLLGIIGLAPCLRNDLGEVEKELLTRLLQPVAEALSAAAYRLEIFRLEADLRRAKGGHLPALSLEAGDDAKPTEKRLVGDSPAMLDLHARIDRAAATDVNVLIRGETGTGKELVAHEIHTRSRRRKGPFVDQHMGALPEHLIEAVLIGFVKDIHSLAHKDKPGLFENADNGSFFMDEVSLMPPLVQEKILRLLQERKVRRVGSDVSIAFDTRIIAATNRDLADLVCEGRMREDLFYRLKGVTIPVPPLRHHLEDLPVLFEYFLQRLAFKWKMPVLRGLRCDRAWLEPTRGWVWPGNVREFESFVEETVSESQGTPDVRIIQSIMDEKRKQAGVPAGPSGQPVSHRERMENAEAGFLRRDLAECEGSVKKAAKKNGLSEATMRRKATRHRLKPAADAQK